MLPKNGILVINKDDMNCNDVVAELSDELVRGQVRVFTFSLSDPTATIYAKNVSCNIKGFYSFDVFDKNTGKSYGFYLTVPGIHNVYDALAAITTAYAYGIDFPIMQKSLNEFCGAKRRFEFKKSLQDNILVYDDYAHHPTEIKATLAAAKQKEHKRVIAVFQPHTYTRTKELLPDFATSFNDATLAIISDIYAAREIDDGTISSKDLVDAINSNGGNAIYIPEFEDIIQYLHQNMQSGDIILTVGAGDITHLSDLL